MRPAEPGERPNGRRRQCGVAKAADAAARRLRGTKAKPSCTHNHLASSHSGRPVTNVTGNKVISTTVSTSIRKKGKDAIATSP